MFEDSATADRSATSDLDNSILIVDDDPGLVQVMGQILSDVGSLRFATNGPDALRLARESAPDLILLDAEMPGMSGFQLFEALRLVRTRRRAMRLLPGGADHVCGGPALPHTQPDRRRH